MEQEFLLKLAEAYQTYDSSVIEDYLADNMHYASMWVFGELTSKQEYLNYLKGKLQTLKSHNVHMEFEVVNGRMHRNALLVTNQPTSEGDYGFVVDFNDEGEVYMLNITSRAFF